MATELREKKKNEISILLDHSQHVNNTNISNQMSSQVGTPMYFSPEQKEGLPCSQKVDIWAMGLILYEMCSIFRTGMERILNMDKLKNDHIINQLVIEKYPIEGELIYRMTNRKPSDRPSAQEILDSDLMKNWKIQLD